MTAESGGKNAIAVVEQCTVGKCSANNLSQRDVGGAETSLQYHAYYSN